VGLFQTRRERSEIGLKKRIGVHEKWRNGRDVSLPEWQLPG